jgi:membrane associated rhomboid family serine protease
VHVVVGICALVWMAVSVAALMGAPGPTLWAEAWLALSTSAVVQQGAVWQLITYAFVHFDMWHIAFNGIALLSFGVPFERAWGAGRFLLVFLVGAVASGLACLAEAYIWRLWGGAVHPMLVIGASGGVCSLVVCFAAWQPDARVVLLFIPMRAWAMVVVMLALDTIGLLLPYTGIAHSGHIGGTLAGLALCPVLIGRWPWGRRAPTVRYVD